jgi:hypothetical protein
MSLVVRLLRITAWALLVIGLLELISGFLTTKYFLFEWADYALVYTIHTRLMPLVFIPLFYLHSLCGLLFLIQRKIRLGTAFRWPIVAVWSVLFLMFAWLYIAEATVKPASLSTTLLPPKPLSGSQHSLRDTVTLSLSEIAKHDDKNSCWIIVGEKVYDMTAYLDYHPGGADTILPYCGRDATYGFDTKGKDKPHSPNAAALLDKFYIGEVGSILTNKAIKNEANKLANIFNRLKNSLLTGFPDANIKELKPKGKNYDAKLVYQGTVYKVTLDENGNILKIKVHD